MKTKFTTSLRSRSRRGSVLITSVIFIVALTTVLAGVATYQMSVNRLQRRAEALLQARYTAEGAIAQAADQVSMLTGAFAAGENFGITMPVTYFAERDFAPAGVASLNWMPSTPKLAISQDGQAFGGGRMVGYTVDALQIVPGLLRPATAPRRFPVNGPDAPREPQLRGRLASTHVVPLLAAARIQMENGGMMTAYTYRDVGIHLVPMFGDAVWYLPTLEIGNGAPLTLNGRVYAGGDMYVSGGGATLTISQNTYAVGNIFYGRHPLFLDGTLDNRLSMVTMFRTLPNGTVSTSTWQSNLNLSTNLVDPSNRALGSLPNANWRTRFAELFGDGVVAQQAPMHLPGTPRDMNGQNFQSGGRNGSRFLIEPGQPLPDASDENFLPRLQMETQKFYHRANLRIEFDVKRNSDGSLAAPPVARAFKAAERNSQGMVTRWDEVSLPPGAVTFNATMTAPSLAAPNAAFLDRRRARVRNNGAPSVNGNGGYILPVDIDMSILRDAVELTGDSSHRFGTEPPRAKFDPATDWNGIVYVQSLNPSAGTGVRLRNGSRIPSRGGTGMTLATNDALYVEGNFNADGNASTGQNGIPDHMQETSGSLTNRSGVTRQEFPAALIADAVTIVSQGYTGTTTNNNNPTPSQSFIEVSAAIISGIVPSTAGYYSGGLENFPRFLENWKDKTVRYRGSMVSLFASEVANETWNIGYYNAPIRDWAFNRSFESLGGLPPGTPMAVFRADLSSPNFRQFSEAEFTAEYNRILNEIQAAGIARTVTENRFRPYRKDGVRLAAGVLRRDSAPPLVSEETQDPMEN
jgi:hypothetical protein